MSTPPSNQKEFSPPAAFLKHLIDICEIGRYRRNKSIGELEIYFLDLSRLKLNVTFFTPFIVPSALSAHRLITTARLDALLPEVQHAVREIGCPFALLVLGGKLQKEDANLIRRFGNASIAILSKPVMDLIVECDDSETAWKQLATELVKYLGRRTLSPYQPGRPVSCGRFFGRQEALNRVLSGGKYGGNFTVVGNRRIGKTSLLHEVRARLLRDNPRMRTAIVHGNLVHSTYQVVEQLFAQLRPDLVNRLSSDASMVDSLAVHITAIPEKHNEDVAVFVDELDHILEWDSKDKHRLMNLLRSTFEHSRCRILFAGFRRVMDEKNRLDTPLYNFTDAITLNSLTRNESAEMIGRPMLLLGIDLYPGLTEVIMHETGGHPELIQMFCSKMIEIHACDGATPNVDQLLSAITDDEIFRQKVYRTFTRNTNSLEKLLTYLLVTDALTRDISFDRYEFVLRDCDRLLKMRGFTLTLSSMDSLVENLRVGGIVATVLGRNRAFRFAVPRLADYCMADDIEFMIDKATEELATHPDPMKLLVEDELDDQAPGEGIDV